VRRQAFIIVGFLLVMAGCATKGRPLDASVYLLNTNRNTTALLNSLSEEFKANKYIIETRSNSLGVLSLQPRRFAIPRGENKSSFGEQIIQIRQEGGSVKVSITYRCEDPTKGSMGPCFQRDEAATNKIARIERMLLEVFNKHMYKSKSDLIPKSKVLDEIHPAPRQ
jgi:hypothetical protein